MRLIMFSLLVWCVLMISLLVEVAESKCHIGAFLVAFHRSFCTPSTSYVSTHVLMHVFIIAHDGSTFWMSIASLIRSIFNARQEREGVQPYEEIALWKCFTVTWIPHSNTSTNASNTIHTHHTCCVSDSDTIGSFLLSTMDKTVIHQLIKTASFHFQPFFHTHDRDTLKTHRSLCQTCSEH